MQLHLQLDVGHELRRELDTEYLLQISNDIADWFNYKNLEEKLKIHDWNSISNQLKLLRQKAQDKIEKRRISLLTRLINMAAAQNIEEYREAQRTYTIDFALLIYFGLVDLEQKEKVDFSEEKEAIAHLYWTQQVIEARRVDPSFPVWESLRIVCARPTLEDDELENDDELDEEGEMNLDDE